MDFGEYLEMVKPRTRVLRGMFLGVMVALGLAAAYVWKGMALLGNSQFTTVDGYAFAIALFVGSLVSLSYWVYFRDVSEAVAIQATIVYSLFFGLQDIFVYSLLPDTSIPDVLPWLNDSFVGIVAGWLGYSSVTKGALFAVVLLTGLLLIVFVKTLDDFEQDAFGVNL